MIDTQTVAGATEFNGTAGKGLVVFTAAYDFSRTSDDVVPMISSIAYDGGSTAADNVVIKFRDVAGAATEILPLWGRDSTISLLDLCNPRIPVPRSGATVWQLEVHTTTKTATASVTVVWAPGRAEGS